MQTNKAENLIAKISFVGYNINKNFYVFMEILGCRRGINNMINVWIDDLTPCLKNNDTGDFVSTEVVRIRRKSFLAKFNKKNGWYTNWKSF